jgi:PAS domain S-box-containing protein
MMAPLADSVLAPPSKILSPEKKRPSECPNSQPGETSLPTVLLLASSGSILHVSASITSLIGYTSEELIGRNLLDLLHPEDAGPLHQLFTAGWAAPGHEEIVDYRCRHKDGSWRYLNGTHTLRQVDPQTPVILVIQRDITARKQAEETLRASEARYRSMMDNLEQSVFLKDPQGRFIAANKRFCQGLGRRKTEIIGKTDYDFYPQHLAEKYRADDRLVLREGQPVETEEQTLKDGTMCVVRIVKTPLRDEQGGIVGVLGIFWDVTEQRNLEAQLRHAQKMDAVGQLAGGIAHDFNNLLTAIVSNIALTLGDLSDTDPKREQLVATETAALRASELTHRLLGFSRKTVLRPQPANLHTCIEETVRILRRTIDPRISVEMNSPTDLWTVLADPGQMNQVLMNLCLNARDAMPEGGRLLLQTENVLLSEDYARHHVEARAGEFVRLTVQDTGHGILPEIRSRIFEPFFTTKASGQGMGLGLAMVFGIVKQHQGWINCYSEVNQGTQFAIYLPRHAEAEAAPSAPAVAQLPNGGTETILLADDEALIRSVGRTILQRYGYQVLLAEDGQQAVELYQREKERIDLVILDLTMPRLSGRDTFQQLFAIDSRVRVLFASGYSVEQLNEAENDRIFGFVSKPYRPEELAHKVRVALDKKQLYTVRS